MTAAHTTEPLLDEARAGFITHSVSMCVASCDAAGVPSLVRGHGCRVSADRRQVTVFVSALRAAAVLNDLRSGRAVAVAFTLPSTHETLQLKGPAATIVPLEPADLARIRAYAESFAREIHGLGYKEPFARALVSGLDEEHVGVAFEPAAAFVQTPGPNAGQRLEGRP